MLDAAGSTETVRAHLEAILAEHRGINIHPTERMALMVCGQCGGRGGTRHPCLANQHAVAALDLLNNAPRWEWDTYWRLLADPDESDPAPRGDAE